jgi:hypothetical protein
MPPRRHRGKPKLIHVNPTKSNQVIFSDTFLHIHTFPSLCVLCVLSRQLQSGGPAAGGSIDWRSSSGIFGGIQVLWSFLREEKQVADTMASCSSSICHARSIHVRPTVFVHQT